MAEEEKKNPKVNKAKQAELRKESKKQAEKEDIEEAKPAELRQKLSNKNADYVYRLQKELQRQGKLTPAQAKDSVDSLLPEIIIAQRNGQPANGLYMASPKIKANQLLHPKPKVIPLMAHPFWQRAVDNILLWFTIFFGFYGLLGLFNSTNSKGTQNGVLTILVLSIVMGIFLAKYNEWVTPYTNNQERKRLPWMKLIVSSVIFVVVAVGVMWILTEPWARVINPILPGIVNIIIAAASFGIRYLFRKYYHIVGSSFAPGGAQRRSK